MSDYTNFHGYSHGDMRSMVESMDSGGVMAAGDPWRKATETLKQIRTALNVASADATSDWEGSTSDAFYSKMTKLANAVNNAAAYANDAAAAMQMMSEAIDTAKRDMPEEPSWLDKAGDAISDTAQSTVGVDDEDTRTAVTDEKKAQAVAVMETLASKYRATTNYLKPPSGGFETVEDIPPPDSAGPAALGAMIMGGGMGLSGGRASGGSVGSSRTTGPSLGQAPQSPKVTTVHPGDPGIKGGVSSPPPKPKAPGTFSPGTGLDGIHAGAPGTTAGGHAPNQGAGHGGSSQGGGSSSTGLGGAGGLRGGGGGSAGAGAKSGGTAGVGGMRGGAAGSGAGSGAQGSSSGAGGRGSGGFGSGGMDGAKGSGLGARGTGGGASGGGLARKGGGVVGETAHGGAGKSAFTEGGSGLGRGRTQGGQGGQGQGQGHGMPGNAQSGKKDKKQGRERPDYLVEDEETWASGERVNPDVVE
ncbi:hypothetical protein [Kitasatospora sp. NPDC088346]|uniref:hypothetical protein n=1 Tax=Kitasatospora sp. NPDC088346 TaxID=3364073 RepID=UPI003800F4E9